MKILVDCFLVTKKPELDNWLEKNKKNLRSLLKETHFIEFILTAIIACCVISRFANSNNYNQPLPPSGPYMTYQSPFASLSHGFGRKTGRVSNYVPLPKVEPPVTLISGKAAQIQRSKVFRQSRLVIAKQTPANRNHRKNADLNMHHLQSKYPASTISVNVGAPSENSPQTHVNLVNSGGQYRELGNINNAQATYLKNNSSLIVAQHEITDREHLLIDPLLIGLNISRENGYCYNMLSSHHNIHTQYMKKDGFLWTPEYSYLENNGTFCDMVDGFSANYTGHLRSMYSSNPSAKCMIVVNNQNITPVAHLALFGSDPDAVVLAAETGFQMEQSRIRNMNIPENLLLPVVHNSMLNKKGAADFTKFLNASSPVLGDFNIQQPSQSLQHGLERGQYIVTHFKSIEPYMVPGTPEYIEVQKSFKVVHTMAHQAMDFVEEQGHPVSPGIRQIWDINNARAIDIKEMENKLRTEHGFFNYYNGTPSLFASGELRFSGQ